jgi:hypothetical protein
VFVEALSATNHTAVNPMCSISSMICRVILYSSSAVILYTRKYPTITQ